MAETPLRLVRGNIPFQASVFGELKLIGPALGVGGEVAMGAAALTAMAGDDASQGPPNFK